MSVRLLPDDKQLGFAPYLWLAYLAIYVSGPWLQGRATPHVLLVTLLGLLLFLPLYFRGYWLSGRALVRVVAALMLLGSLIAPWNASATVFFVYAAAFIGFSGEPRFALRLLAAQLFVVALAAWALALPISSWAAGLVFSALVGAVNIHTGQIARINARLRLAQDEVEQLARLAERERIARDLHDLLGHSLSLIVLKSELAGKLLARDPARAVDELRDLERAAREALQAVRSALQGWRHGGFASELERAKEALRTAGVDLDSQSEPVPLTAEQETVLALGLREAVTNVVRHARARSCRVRLGRAGKWALLEVHDDGRGGLPAEGLGLQGMRERLQALGGALERSESGGTLLRLTLPLREAEGAQGVIRVVIAEDQAMVLGALAALLEIEGDIAVVGRARDGKQALALVREQSPDVVLTDIEMPEVSGLDLARELSARGPRPRVVILTTFARPGYLRRALEAGAAGYLLKDAPAEQLADAVRRAHAGLRVVAPELAVEAWGLADPLTERERQTLRLAEEGLSSAEIAVRLGLSDGTVRNYLSEAIGKLGAQNRTEAARLARQKGWL